jgi:hypothetical protein
MRRSCKIEDEVFFMSVVLRRTQVTTRGVAAAGIRDGRVFIRKRMRAALRVITSCCYYKPVMDYARSIAKSVGTSMLFSSGDSSRTLSSILSGEGLDEREQEESPLLFSPHSSQRTA